MTVLILHRRFPCCGGASRFVADVPSYDRTCRSCGSAWTVRRIASPPSDFARRLGAQFVTLVWERRSENDTRVVRRGRIGVATKSGAGAAAQTAPRRGAKPIGGLAR